MKSITCLLAAGILLLPASGMAAEQEAEIHAVMAAEESHTEDAAAPAKEDGGGASAAARAETSEEKDDATHDDALDKEMDAVGDGDSHADAAGKSDTDHARETKPAANADAPAAADTATDADTAPGTIGFISELPEDETNASVNKPRMTDAADTAADRGTEHPAAAAAETGAAAATAASAEPQSPADANDADKAAGQKHKAGKTASSKHAADKAAVAAAAAAKREAYGKETAIEPITLKDGDWVFIEGDERRGWFFDRSHMKRNADGSISYWQLILYNNLGRAQFAEAMKNADYEHLGYTMQRRVLSPKKDAISTYEILAYDGDNALITESSREGHRAVIRANTMTEKERDAVRQELRRKK